MQKSMQIYAQNITQYACAHTIQNAEMKQAKNCNTHFAINNAKKPGTKHKKSPKQSIHVGQNIYQKAYIEYLCKSAKFVHACAWKPGQRSLRHFLANCQDASSANRIF